MTRLYYSTRNLEYEPALVQEDHGDREDLHMTSWVALNPSMTKKGKYFAHPV